MASPIDNIRDQFRDLINGMENVVTTLEKKKSTLLEEISRLKREKTSPQTFNFIRERVKLDVGGRNYSSSMETLTAVPDSLLAKIVRGDVPCERGNDGRIFIDRDGRHFRHILNFLRDPENFSIKIKDKNVLEEVKREANFFGVEEQMFSSFSPESLDWLTGIKIHSFSTQHSNFPASNVLDVGLTYWLSDTGTTTNQWIIFDFQKQVYVNKILIKVDNYECTVKDFAIETVEGDPSSGTWRPLKEFQAQCGLNCTTDQIFTGVEFKGRYLRLFAKNNWGPGGGTYILITNVRFFGSSL
jgi:hypothetical protein